MFQLEIDDGESGVRELRFEQSAVTIGRDASMDVCLDDATVSRQSAVLVVRDGRVYVQDLGGKNPVRVNGRPTVSQALREGDVVGLGRYNLTFRAGDASGVSSAAETVLDPRQSIESWQRAVGAPGAVDALAVAPPPASPERMLVVLQSFAELIQRLPERESLFVSALAPVSDFLDVKRSFIGLFSREGVLDIVAEKNEDGTEGGGFSRSIVDRVRRDKIAILFADDPTTPSRHESRSLVRLRIKSAMCVPIFRDDDVRGVLYLDNRGGDRSFTRGDLHFANILAHFISLALDKEELYRRIHEENLSLKTMLRRHHQLVGSSPVARELNRQIRRVAAHDATVLVLGESGTGKELVARAIHDRSPRREGPFVAVNCAAIPENLLESELFGYAPKSGISGANPEGKQGKFEAAHKGTLFLDEIGDMTPATQAKILRVLEDHVVERLGGSESIAVDLRVVAATNKDLDAAVEEGTFREDLLYRLKVFQFRLRPLRERTEDIVPLAKHFVRLLGGDETVRISPRAREALLGYRWPGNIRELRNVVQNAYLMSNGKVIYPENLPEEFSRDENKRVFGSLAEIEARHLRRVLDGVNWNKRRAAEILGINRSTLYEKIKHYEIERKDGSG